MAYSRFSRNDRAAQFMAPPSNRQPGSPLPGASSGSEATPQMVEFMNLIRVELRHILQHQDQKFELVLKAQSSLHADMDNLLQSSSRLNQGMDRLLQSSREQFSNSVAKSTNPSLITPRNEAGNTSGPIDIDALRDLVGEVRLERSKLAEVQRAYSEDVSNEEQQKKVLVMQMKEMRENLDKVLSKVQGSSFSQVGPSPPELNAAIMPGAMMSSPAPPPAKADDGAIDGDQEDTQETKRPIITRPPILSDAQLEEHRRRLRTEHTSMLDTSSPTAGQRVASEEEIDIQMNALMGNEEPGEGKTRDVFYHLATHKMVELFFGIFILLNAITMAVQMQYDGLIAGADISFKDVAVPPKWINDILKVLDLIFLIIFCIELCLKLVGLKKDFWFSAWNWLDFVIVVFGVVEEFSLIDIGVDPMILRLVRLVKLSRFLKMFRMAGNLFVLSLIMKSVRTTFSTLCWAMLLLFMVKAVFGMLVSQLVYTFLTDPDADEEAKTAIYRYYGTFTRTMFTMFEVTHVNYSRAARVLTDNMDEGWAWFFVVYRVVVGFAVLQVIRAVFIQQVLKVATDDRDLLLLSRATERAKLVKKLSDVFSLIDVAGLGQVGPHEFVKVLHNSQVQTYLSSLDINPTHPEVLFKLLDTNSDGTVTAEEFIQGTASLRGAARGIDVAQALRLVRRLEHKIDLSGIVPQGVHITLQGADGVRVDRDHNDHHVANVVAAA